MVGSKSIKSSEMDLIESCKTEQPNGPMDEAC